MKVQKNKKTPFLSVVVPAYKAEKIIEKSLLGIKGVLDRVGYSYEVICVVDGQVDKTYEIAEKVAKRFPRKIKVFAYLTNLGKGHAVRFGMGKARGEIIGFVDAGFELNPIGINMLLQHLLWYRADIIVASKRHPASKVIYPWQRKILSFCYQMLVRALFGLKIRDTQVGMKFFRREVLSETLPRLLIKEWAFDIEMLVVANYLGFKRIYEAPVEEHIQFGGVSVLTSKSFLKNVWGMLKDTLAVFYRLKILNYYSYKNRKSWITPKYLTLDKA